MTSASELFCNRRSRVGRNSLDLGLDSSVDRSFHHHGHTNRRHHHNHQDHNTNRRDRHDVEGCDLRRTPQIRHQSLRPSASERDTVRVDVGSSESSSVSITNLESFGTIRSSRRFSRNNRLPGAVLLARERLLERLRGVSLYGHRQGNRASLGITSNRASLEDDFRLVDEGEWEIEISTELLAGRTPFADSIPQTDQLLRSRMISKRPPGLTQVAINSLQLEVFSEAKDNDEGEMLRASQDCSICLESFQEGDKLICLPCTHRFHAHCLYLWVRTCGDCPYCRRVVVGTSHLEQ